MRGHVRSPDRVARAIDTPERPAGDQQAALQLIVGLTALLEIAPVFCRVDRPDGIFLPGLDRIELARSGVRGLLRVADFPVIESHEALCRALRIERDSAALDDLVSARRFLAARPKREHAGQHSDSESLRVHGGLT